MRAQHEKKWKTKNTMQLAVDMAKTGRSPGLWDSPLKHSAAAAEQAANKAERDG